MINFRILIILVIFSCGTKKIIINSPDEKANNEIVDKKVSNNQSKVNNTTSPVINNVNDYIDYFSGVAMDEMRTYKIPASITLAQGILESGSGKGRLSVEANNHFGKGEYSQAIVIYDEILEVVPTAKSRIKNTKQF